MGVALRYSKRRPVYPMPSALTPDPLPSLSTRHDTLEIVQSTCTRFETGQEISLIG